MVSPRAQPDIGEDSEATPSPPGAPRWVKVAAGIGVLLVLVIIAMLLFGGGSHGPGRHTGDDARPSSPAQNQAPPSSGDGAHTPPAGGH